MQSEGTAQLASLVAEVVALEIPSDASEVNSQLAASAMRHVRSAFSDSGGASLAEVFDAVTEEALGNR